MKKLILMAMLLIELPQISFYFPVLFLISIPTGIFVGMTGNVLKERISVINEY